MFTTAMMLATAPIPATSAPPAIPAQSPVVTVIDQPSVVSPTTAVPADQEPLVDAPIPGVVPAPTPNAPPPILPEPTSPAAGTPRKSATPPDDIVVTARERGAAPDPLRELNATSFDATQAVDSAVIGPVAVAYKRNVPSPIRSGIHNFLYNLREPIVFLNFLLQFKAGKAAETVGRFVINSTVGAAGVFDIAKRKPFRLPRRSNGFANTLGYHGVKNGPFLFLPLVGPTTVRDLLGGTIDRLILPAAVGAPFNSATYTVPAGILGALDHRAEFDETLQILHDGVADPYAASRAFYLQRRQAEIDHLRGRRGPAAQRLTREQAAEKAVSPQRRVGELVPNPTPAPIPAPTTLDPATAIPLP